MSAGVIPYDYQGLPVLFDPNGWLHATAIAAKFGKEPYAWLISIDTVSYMVALAAALTSDYESPFLQDLNKINGLDSSKASTKAKALKLVKAVGLVVTRGGSPETGGGTWLHPKLAVVFARWLDIRFAVWCDLHIDALLGSDPAARQGYGQACQQLENRRTKASKDGSGLAHWRWDKADLEQGAAYWREQLQLTLGLEAGTP